MARLEKIHHLRITLDIVTKGSEPLELDEDTQEKLAVAFDYAVGRHVDLRYHPEGNRYLDAYHRLLGTEIVAVGA